MSDGSDAFDEQEAEAATPAAVAAAGAGVQAAGAEEVSQRVNDRLGNELCDAFADEEDMGDWVLTDKIPSMYTKPQIQHPTPATIHSINYQRPTTRPRGMPQRTRHKPNPPNDTTAQSSPRLRPR
jgi:hypothetical protein